ncbi:hypothetical protein PUNSTDRAFT_142490 [Punctularia strigosozonata HHB-11173 SS5]|uniref:uncharacterized protein n=1 Tax=Punctularia strigosozonata (strain HHB-11173) TaxID=741275 RepID=UPI0004416EC1|nr:uncharacterized protein PUNSTDRAFT_142490 [Punctularia strigosozonata HHB-11173 SS5]EIN10483.1 hypothetical protein PUNSTDRAFT_142490 [Punctularia strigosozonata HHB-11173 SS5]
MAMMNQMREFGEAFLGRDMFSRLDFWTEHLPFHLQENVTRDQSFYRGYAALFEAIHVVLARSDDYPPISTPSAILDMITNMDADGQRFVAYYMERGGLIEHALSCVTHLAKCHSPLGDRAFDQAASREWNALPTCANDLAFYLVRRKIGLDPRQQWGPYRDAPTNVREEEGDNEELHASTGMTLDMLKETNRFRTWAPRVPLPITAFSSDSCIYHLPPHLRGSIYRTFYDGYLCIFGAIVCVLKRSGDHGPPIPTPAAVLDELRTLDFVKLRAVQFYFDKGGLIEYALDHVTAFAADQSPLGDGEFDSLAAEDDLEIDEDLRQYLFNLDPALVSSEGQLAREWNALPTCANDLKFRLVRLKIGLEPTRRWGPYPNIPAILGPEEDEDMDGSEEELVADA